MLHGTKCVPFTLKSPQILGCNLYVVLPEILGFICFRISKKMQSSCHDNKITPKKGKLNIFKNQRFSGRGVTVGEYPDEDILTPVTCMLCESGLEFVNSSQTFIRWQHFPLYMIVSFINLIIPMMPNKHMYLFNTLCD